MSVSEDLNMGETVTVVIEDALGATTIKGRVVALAESYGNRDKLRLKVWGLDEWIDLNEPNVVARRGK